MSVERSNTVTRPSPDTVAKTVLVLKQLAVPSIRINGDPTVAKKTQKLDKLGECCGDLGCGDMYLGTSNMEPMKHHQHKSRGQTYDWNCIFEELEGKRKKVHGACYLPQNRNLMIHVPKQHIVFGCTAEGKDHIMRRAQSAKAKMKREPPEEDFRIKRVPGYRVHGCHVGTVCSQNIDNSKTLQLKTRIPIILKALIFAKTKPAS